MLQQTASRQLSICRTDLSRRIRPVSATKLASLASRRLSGRPVFSVDPDPAEDGDGVRRPRYTLNDFRLLAKPSAASFVADTERSLLRRTGGQMLSCREAVCCSIGQHSERCPNHVSRISLGPTASC